MGAIQKHEPLHGELDVERARAILAACCDLDEVKRVRDQAEAVARYQRSRNAAEDSAVHASAIARRAERRLGELLAEMPKDEGGRPPKTGHDDVPVSTTLRDLGITKNQSSAWQAIASVPEEDFETELAEDIEKHRIPSAAKFVRMGKDARAPAPPAPPLEPDDADDPDDCVPESGPWPSAQPSATPSNEPPPPATRSPTAKSITDTLKDCVRGLTAAERAELFRDLGVVPAESLTNLQQQRDSDNEYYAWRQREADIKTKFGASRPQKKIDFVLAGGELALALLGLDYTVTPEKLAEVYRAAALAAHPDRGGDPTVMSSLNQAYAIVRSFVEAA